MRFLEQLSGVGNRKRPPYCSQCSWVCISHLALKGVGSNQKPTMNIVLPAGTAFGKFISLLVFLYLLPGK